MNISPEQVTENLNTPGDAADILSVVFSRIEAVTVSEKSALLAAGVWASEFAGTVLLRFSESGAYAQKRVRKPDGKFNAGGWDLGWHAFTA